MLDSKKVMSSEPDEVSNGIQGLLNETDSELSSLSHLDAPNESVYMICGVLIAMVLVGIIIILLAVTINKLRKREDNHSHPQDVVLQTTTVTPSANVTTAVTSITQPPPQPLPPEQTSPPETVIFPPPFLWQYSNHYSPYSTDQETLVQSLPTERPGFCRGFRKNLRGQWKRLVRKKPSSEVYTIPPELKDQLKTIYVY